MADGKMIEYRVDNGIAVLEINRPPVNSYTTELLKELDAVILDARFDDNVHAIVITGKVEKFFSAGADINMLSKQSLGFKNNFALHGHEVLMRLENTPKIVIAAINGHAVGGGLGDRHGLRYPHRQKRRRSRRTCRNQPRRYARHGRHAAFTAPGRQSPRAGTLCYRKNDRIRRSPRDGLGSLHLRKRKFHAGSDGLRAPVHVCRTRAVSPSAK